MNRKISVIVVLVALLLVAVISVNLLPTQQVDQPGGPGQAIDQPGNKGQQLSPGTSLSGGIPHKLAEFNVVNVVTGPEAVQSISRLHGTGIDFVDGFVVEYVAADESSMFILWVSESRNDEEARALFNRMDEKMPGSQVFLDRTEIEVDGRTYVYVTGAGMENYYWVAGTKIYWVGVMEGDGAEILQIVIENF